MLDYIDLSQARVSFAHPINYPSMKLRGEDKEDNDIGTPKWSGL